MTAWYAGSALVLILAATGLLYLVLASSLEVEDRHTLANIIEDLRPMLSATGAQDLGIHPGQAAGQSGRHTRELWVRVIGAGGRTLFESPGMWSMLPASIFPTPGPLDGQGAERRLNNAGRLFQVISVGAFAGQERRVLQAAMDQDDEERLLAHYRERLWLVLVASVGLCATVGLAIARQGIRPIERVTATARKVSSATLHERIDDVNLPTELRALAKTFNEMLDRLEGSFAVVSQFSADVAHELRTPINNLRGEIEVALGKARSDDEYRETLGSALEECVRISRVIQSLLFLARAEAATEGQPHNTIHVQREIAAVLDFYEAAAADAGVTLHAVASAELLVPFERTLFQQAVGNLVANAIVHTPAGGNIAIQTRHEGDNMCIDITDTGCGIAPEHLPHVFDRFYRVDAARSAAGGHVGLGLAMVRSIATIHGGRVTIDSELGRGTRVTLSTPLHAGASRQIT